MNFERLKSLPKIELHCHLDGSLRPETALELGIANKLLPDTTTLEDVMGQLMAPRDCDSLDTYLKRFDLPIALMQSEEVIERIAFELFEDAAKENVYYLEVRFAPHLHTRTSLSLNQVINAALKGMERAQQLHPIKGNYILSHLRHHTVESMYSMIDAGLPYLQNGVVAVDLAGSEQLGYAHKFVDPVNYARTKGYQITMHAGETGYYENVEQAVTLLGATRVGHGCAIIKNPVVADLVKSKHVVIEACPTSNLQTRIVDIPQHHPIHEFYTSGLSVMVNTDNRTVSDTTMTREFLMLHQTFGWDIKVFKEIYQFGIEGAFCDVNTKVWLENKLSDFDNSI